MGNATRFGAMAVERKARRDAILQGSHVEHVRHDLHLIDTCAAHRHAFIARLPLS